MSDGGWMRSFACLDNTFLRTDISQNKIIQCVYHYMVHAFSLPLRTFAWTCMCRQGLHATSNSTTLDTRWMCNELAHTHAMFGLSNYRYNAWHFSETWRYPYLFLCCMGRGHDRIGQYTVHCCPAPMKRASAISTCSLISSIALPLFSACMTLTLMFPMPFLLLLKALHPYFIVLSTNNAQAEGIKSMSEDSQLLGYCS